MTFKAEAQAAFSQCTVEEFVSSEVPHHDGPAAVLATGYCSFKVNITKRMIFRRHCEAFVRACIRRAFGDCPGFQDVIHFKPEVVMKMTGGVFLNDETVARFTWRDWSGRGLACFS